MYGLLHLEGRGLYTATIIDVQDCGSYSADLYDPILAARNPSCTLIGWLVLVSTPVTEKTVNGGFYIATLTIDHRSTCK